MSRLPVKIHPEIKGTVRANNLYEAAVAGERLWSRISWRRLLPFFALHLAAFSVLWVGISLTAVVVAVGFFFLRVFALTGFYHRYFSHRAFKTSRWFQFIGAVLGNTAAQRGPLWWAAHHREHHRSSDGPDDVHSPRQNGFLWSHVLDEGRQNTLAPEIRRMSRGASSLPVAFTPWRDRS